MNDTNLILDNIVFTYEDDMIRELKDPLEGLDIHAESPKYYRLNEVVFAEPIAITNEIETNDAEAGIKGSFSDSLILKKTVGEKHFVDKSNSSPSTKCPQINCNKDFSTTKLLKSHIRRVHCADHKKYICEYCAAGFSASYLLQRHMVVHSHQKAECPLCGKLLSKRTDMSVHLQRHTNTRPHACHLCQKKFVRRTTLKTHLRFVHHTGELCCHKCGEGFSSRKLFMNHKSCCPK